MNGPDHHGREAILSGSDDNAKLQEEADRAAQAAKEEREGRSTQKKYPLSMGLEAYRAKYTPKKKTPFKGSIISAITAEGEVGQRCFVALYEM